MSFDKRSEDEKEIDDLMHGQQIQNIEAIFYDAKKDKPRMFRRIKMFLKDHPSIRMIIRPNQIIIQDRNE